MIGKLLLLLKRNRSYEENTDAMQAWIIAGCLVVCVVLLAFGGLR